MTVFLTAVILMKYLTSPFFPDHRDVTVALTFGFLIAGCL